MGHKYDRSFQGRYRRGKARAKKRNIPWTLSLDEYVKIVFEARCEYCEEKLPETGFGLDRKNDSQGYHPENVVPCCTECNLAKHKHYTYGEMKVVAQVVKALRGFKKK